MEHREEFLQGRKPGFGRIAGKSIPDFFVHGIEKA